MLAIRAYLLVDLLGQRGGYARFISPGSWDATYDTNRVRKLVATGDELGTLDDVEQALLPLLPLEVESQFEPGHALIERLPSLLAEHGIEVEAAQTVVDAFVANESILERLHEHRSGREA
jgi:hypothetical protein